MAELDERTGGALARALERALEMEDARPVHCIDVSRLGRRWDVEAFDQDGGDLVRRISHTRALSESGEKALNEIATDITPAIERRLAERGVRSCLVGYHAHELPTSRQQRQRLAQLVADQIAATLSRVHATSYDLVRLLSEDPHPERNPIFRAFHDVTVHRVPGDIPAQVLGCTDDRLWSWEAPLLSVVVPVINKSVDKHRELVPDLTLVIELQNRQVTDAAASELAAALEERQRAFKSLYLGRVTFPEWEMELARVY